MTHNKNHVLFDLETKSSTATISKKAMVVGSKDKKIAFNMCPAFT